MDNRQIIGRRREEKDVSDWFRLRRLLWDRSSDEEHRAEMADIYKHTETQLVLVAENADDKLVGFLEASIRPFVEDCQTDHVGYLEGWFVEKDYRRLRNRQKISAKRGKLGAAQRLYGNGFRCGVRKRIEPPSASKARIRRNFAARSSAKRFGVRR